MEATDQIIDIFKTNTQLRDDTDYHNFAHRKGQFKNTGKDDGLEKRIRYSLDRQKDRRRSLISQVRSIIFAEQQNLDSSVDSINAECNSYNETSFDTSNNNNSNLDISFEYNNNTSFNNDSYHGNILEDDNLMNENDLFEEEGEEDIFMSDEESYKNKKHNNNINNKKKKKKRNRNRNKSNSTNQQNNKNKQIQLYSNHIMLADDMKSLPSNLSEDWYCVVVPDGKRCIVITQHQETIVRSPDGQVMFKCQTLIPYGSSKSKEQGGNIRNQHCILDCLFEEQTNRFYVLDVLSWKGYLLYDHDVAFRFFWRDQKLSETFGVSNQSQEFPYSFHSLYYGEPTIPLLVSIVNDDNIPLDSKNKLIKNPKDYLLFYHKDSQYEFGITPLFTFLHYSLISQLIQEIIDKNNNLINF